LPKITKLCKNKLAPTMTRRSWRIMFSMDCQILRRWKRNTNEVEESTWDSRQTVHSYEVGDLNLL